MAKIQDTILHRANYTPTTTTFSTNFNAITPGFYDYTNNPACQNIQVLDLIPGVAYWIKQITVSGNVPQEDYLGAINVFPALTMTILSRPNEAVYRFPIPVDKYIDNAPCDAWIYCNRENDFLRLSLSGLFIQLPSMLGMITLSINVGFSIFAINDAHFMERFRREVRA